MDIVISALADSFIDSVKLIPLLLVIYLAIEIVEYRYGNRLGRAVERAGKAGPAIGAVAGSIPQCGISVIGAALYDQRLITTGTLLAVFLSTSDEAIPVILSQPSQAGVLVPIILLKIVIAIICGYGIDLVFARRNRETLAHIDAVKLGIDEADHDHSHVLDEKACCGHHPTEDHPSGEGRRSPGFKELFFHPLVHTLKIFAFIFAISFCLALIMGYVGTDRLSELFAGHVILQPLFAAIIGLIPNCAASVAITELYLSGIISFGSVIAGLCASGGLGVLVLFKEGDKKQALKIVGILLLLSVVSGIIVGLTPLEGML